MPPATAMWLSLIRIASSRPKRWLKPPPQRTAYFSSARRPGVVLRVQQMRALVPAARRRKSAVSGGDAGQPAEEIQRGALGRQHGARRARDRHQVRPGGDARAVARMGSDRDIGREDAGERRPTSVSVTRSPGLRVVATKPLSRQSGASLSLK